MNLRIVLSLIVLVSAPAWAVENNAAALSTEDNIRSMDKDHDGMVSMTEIRAYLESQNGKGYRSELLDEMTAKADARSCSSPFSRSFY
jgi:Ca2+-binding EF-hand superfamily protein